MLMLRGIIQLVGSEALFQWHRCAKPGLAKSIEIETRDNREESEHRSYANLVSHPSQEVGWLTLPKLDPPWLITGPYFCPCSTQGTTPWSSCSSPSHRFCQSSATPFNLSARSNTNMYGKRGCRRSAWTCCIIELERSQNLAGDSKSWNSGKSSPGARLKQDPNGMKGRVRKRNPMQSEMLAEPPCSNHCLFRNGLRLRGPPVLIGSLLLYSHSSRSISPRI